MPTRAWYRSPQGVVESHLTEEQVKEAFLSGKGLLWVDIGDTTLEDGQFLARVFGFHPLTIEDCLDPGVRPPKVDDLETYLFIVSHATEYESTTGRVLSTELDLYLGPHYVVTNHNAPLSSIEEVVRRAENQERTLQLGADFLAHALMDSVIDRALASAIKLSNATDEVEETVLRRPERPALETVAQIKRAAVRLERALVPQLDVVNRLSRGEFPLISDRARLYYRDIHDHLFRISGLIQTIQDRSDSTLNLYLLSVANQQNQVMKVLSIMTSIFLPATLIASIYGMNFQYMPELQWPWGYWGALGTMAAVILGMLAWFRRRHWI